MYKPCLVTWSRILFCYIFGAIILWWRVLVSGSIPGVRLSAGPHKKFTSIHTRVPPKKCNVYTNIDEYLPDAFRKNKNNFCWHQTYENIYEIGRLKHIYEKTPCACDVYTYLLYNIHRWFINFVKTIVMSYECIFLSWTYNKTNII